MCVRLVDVNTRHRAETEMETERLRSAQIQAEKLLEARERAHRQKIKGLEEQVGLCCFLLCFQAGVTCSMQRQLCVLSKPEHLICCGIFSVCICECVCVCVVCIYACLCALLCVCVCVLVYVCVLYYMCVCVHMCVCISVHVCVLCYV